MYILGVSGIYIVFCDPFVSLEIQVVLDLQQQQLELELLSLSDGVIKWVATQFYKLFSHG